MLRKLLALLTLPLLLAACGPEAEELSADINQTLENAIASVPEIDSVGSVNITEGTEGDLTLDASLNLPDEVDIEQAAQNLVNTIQEAIPSAVNFNIEITQGEEVSVLEGALGPDGADWSLNETE